MASAGIPALEPVVLPFGDDALLVDLRERGDDPVGASGARARRRHRRAGGIGRPGAGRRAGMPVAAASSVLVPFAARAP